MEEGDEDGLTLGDIITPKEDIDDLPEKKANPEIEEPSAILTTA